MENYYVYIFLNPKKKGEFSYPNVSQIFQYEPMYIGAGHEYRVKEHFSRCLRKRDSSYYTRFYKYLRALHEKKIAFSYILYEDNISYEKSRETEILLIANIGRQDLGTGPLLNMTEGGDGVRRTHSDAAKKKMSETRKRNFLDGKTSIRKGKDHPWYGKIYTDDEKRILAEKTGFGERNHFYGKTHSEEQREKIKEGRRHGVRRLIFDTLQVIKNEGFPFTEESFNKCRVRKRVIPLFVNIWEYVSLPEIEDFFHLSHKLTICD